MTRFYKVTAIEMPIYFNKEGDHDHNGLIYALSKNVPLLKYIRALANQNSNDDHRIYSKAARTVADRLAMPFPQTVAQARQPHPLVRPLVLRANVNETVEVQLQNKIKGRSVGLHLVGGNYNVETHGNASSSDGSKVGNNKPSLARPDGKYRYKWVCKHEGVFPFHDGGNYSGGEDGTNVHGLFGALIVEPKDTIWRDPVTGRNSTEDDGEMDGLYLDVIPQGIQQENPIAVPDTLDGYDFPDPCDYTDFGVKAHREFVIFFHDEPEFVPPHGDVEPDPCKAHRRGQGQQSRHGRGTIGHGSHGEILPIMPISYRAEPMVNREHLLWRWMKAGLVLDRPVLNEEQHHSSWMFGDPATPILKAYIGDPVRIRLIHGGTKETHVFHLHLYEWHAVPQDLNSPRIDAISISPQTGHTIEPVWGAGNRHQVAGDVIWHCHLYPHFHEGMWGMFRTFETLQEGKTGALLDSNDPVYRGRRIGHYPDGTPIEKLLVLPDRTPPPKPTPSHPGYPLYIPGEIRQKSPTPPWPLAEELITPDLDYRAVPTELERKAFNKTPVPGELFTRRPFAIGQESEWPEGGSWEEPKTGFDLNSSRTVDHNLTVAMMRIEYNGYGWHDKHGHLYYLSEEGSPEGGVRETEPLFFRAQHGQILNLTLKNDLPLEIPETEFDHEFPPCPARPWQGECAPHVHMVKFDPICADGASVGWNYMSGPIAGKKMIYRWWLDQEFGTIFFHDHLFANYRQKHGLFGGLIVEPAGAEFLHPRADKRIVSGLQARIYVPGNEPKQFREFCIGIGDFVPMWDRNDQPLNPPDRPGGHGDQGVMALNYRNDPIHERLGRNAGNRDGHDPALWFSSGPPYNRDPYTIRFDTFENDAIWFRVLQGSHEEQHSFQVHGMRWRRFRVNASSDIRNQQTFGLSEAFTFLQEEPYGAGDYLYKLSSSDDLWLGCWGLIRAYGDKAEDQDTEGLLRLSKNVAEMEEVAEEANLEKAVIEAAVGEEAVADWAGEEDDYAPVHGVRKFFVRAVPRRIIYRSPDLVDPYGLMYLLTGIVGPDGRKEVRQVQNEGMEEPLILRCREGETVKIYLTNELPDELEPEPFAPQVPVEERNPFSNRPERRVSSQVSMHADLLRYDVTKSDGATVGRNPRQTVRPNERRRVYSWETQRPLPRPGERVLNRGEPLGPLLLQDMADFRNHRHHGLIGALIVEAKDATPFFVPPGKDTAIAEDAEEAWDGPRATIFVRNEGGEERVEEMTLLLQDGLRHFVRGNIYSPVADEPSGFGEDEPDHEDQGQKGFNYRSEPVGPAVDHTNIGQSKAWLANPAPSTPVFNVPENSCVRLHLIGATDKPRNQSFTVHGVVWREWRFVGDNGPMVASESAITTGTARTFEFTVGAPGDYAYRSGILKWAVPQGLWGIIRARKAKVAIV